MKSLAARFNVEANEGRLVAVLVALSFCVGLTRLFNATASNTLFLVTFNVSVLPYIYILVAVVIPLVGFINTRLEARVPLVTLLAGNLLGYLVVLGGLRLGLALTTNPWPVFALAVWSEVGWVVTNLTLWGLAGRLLNVRQAKRLYGLIGATGVAAAAVGGLLMPVLVNLIGTPNLILGSVTTLLLSFILLLYAARAFKGAVARPPEPEEATAAPQPGSLGTRTRYILLIVALGMLSYAVFYFIDIIFSQQVQQQFTDEAQLASFTGVFLAVMNLVTFLANLFLVGPFIGRFGMRAGLLVMPGLTALVSGVMALAGFFFAVPGLIFGIAVFNDLLDWVLRDTIFKTAVLILYQPLPPSLRLRVQTLVESVAQPIAQGLAGLSLIGLSWLAFNTLQINLVLLLILAACVALAILLGREYGPALRAALSKRALHFDGAALAVADVTSLEILHVQLISPVPAVVSYAFDKLEELEDPALDGFLLDWLHHDSPEVRKDVLLRLERLKPKPAAGRVRELLSTEPETSVKAAALRALTALERESALAQVEPYLQADEPTVRIGAMVGLLRSGGAARAAAMADELAQMAASPAMAQRLQAAQVLGQVRQAQLYPLLLNLMKDADPKVRQAAVRSAGQLKSRRLWPGVVASLNDSATREEAVLALANGGHSVLLSLQATLAQPNLAPVVALRVLRIVGRIRGEAAIVMLKNVLRSPDVELRYQALSELERCHYRAAAGKDQEQIEAAIEAEVREAVEILAALQDVQAEPGELLERALLEQVAAHRARVLSLLSFLTDPRMFAQVRASLADSTVEKQAYGLEVLESLLDKNLKVWVMPLMESSAPSKTLARLPVKPQHHSRAQRLQLLSKGNSWVAFCTQHVLGDTTMLSLIEKVLTLRTVSIFAGVPESILAEVAALLEESQLKAGETLFSKDEAGDCLYIIVQGRLKVHDGERVLSQLDDRDVVGEMAVLDSAPRLASVTAETPTTLLKLDQGALYELMADRLEVARGIIHVLTRRLRQSMHDLNDLQTQLDLKKQ